MIRGVSEHMMTALQMAVQRFSRLADWGRGRSAQTLVEYALILTLIVVIALLVALSVIGDSTVASINEAANAFNAAP